MDTHLVVNMTMLLVQCPIRRRPGHNSFDRMHWQRSNCRQGGSMRQRIRGLDLRKPYQRLQ